MGRAWEPPEMWKRPGRDPETLVEGLRTAVEVGFHSFAFGILPFSIDADWRPFDTGMESPVVPSRYVDPGS